MTGRIKSYQPGTGYGFIECSEGYAKFGRDVYLSEHELLKLNVETLPVGLEVRFEVEMQGAYPRARNLVLQSHASESDDLALKRCEYMLYDYACALDQLRRLSVAEWAGRCLSPCFTTGRGHASLSALPQG